MERCKNRLWWLQLRSIAARHSRSGASDAADDLAQDLAVAAIQDGTNVANLGGWLERVARNAAINRWRRDHRRRQLLPDAPAPGAPLDPETSALARERDQTLRRHLLALPRDQRRVALLRFHGELGMDAVAARLGLRAVTARTRLHRALTALRAQLQHLRATMLFGWPSAQSALLSLTVLVAGVSSPEIPGPLTRTETAAPRLAQSRGRALSPGPRAAPVINVPAPVSVPPAVRQAASATPARVARPAPAPVLATPAVQRLSFEDDQVDGNRLGPDGELLLLPRQAQHPSLIELRADLVPQLIKSLEEL
jgi:RNA polymerase sigma-70 factor (ECF subfamily)